MTQTRRLFCFFLVTFLCLASTSRAFAADTLSEKIDQDLFLDDEGSGIRPDDTEVSGSGSGTDDEDSPTVIDPDRSGRGRDNSGQDSSGSNKKSTNVDFEPESNKPGIEDPNHIPIDDPNKDPFDRKTTPASFFSQPGILAAIICGAIVGLLCAILLVMFIVYRMRKKDEGSYVLDDSKRATSSYGKSKEFYA